jgi:hypothetical protein
MIVLSEKLNQVKQLLSQTEQAHGEYEERELNGVYDQNWAEWYAEHLLQLGLNSFLTKSLTQPELSRFLSQSFKDFKQDNLGLRWNEYTAQRLLQG